MIKPILTLTCFTLSLGACSAIPEQDSMPVTTPTALPAELDAKVRDRRGRFREIACAVLETTGRELSHYAPCEEVLRNIGVEGGATGEARILEPTRREIIAAMVPGIGWECFENWLEYENEFAENLSRLGIHALIMKVDGLSGSEHNARMIRDAFIAHRDELQEKSVVLIGYSKGAPDALEALVKYPEIRPYVAAMVSVAGAIQGSPLANDVDDDAAKLLKHLPDAECADGDGLAIDSLRTSTRKAWLEANPLPDEIPYYSVVTLPTQERVSNILMGSYRKLAKIDPRNDSQVIFSDQVIPGSTLVAYLNADHWAIAVPVMETHPTIGKWFVDQNEYPREALAGALLRFLQEDLAIFYEDRDDHGDTAEQQ